MHLKVGCKTVVIFLLLTINIIIEYKDKSTYSWQTEWDQGLEQTIHNWHSIGSHPLVYNFSKLGGTQTDYQ